MKCADCDGPLNGGYCLVWGPGKMRKVCLGCGSPTKSYSYEVQIFREVPGNVPQYKEKYYRSDQCSTT